MAREIGNPLGVIDELFAARAEQNKVPPSEWGEREHFLQALQLSDEENFAKVPCLNDMQLVEQVKPFTLVRYRCLVQDVFEPELYSMILLEQNAHDPKQSRFVNTKYRECYPSQEGTTLQDVGRSGLSTRGAYYCVPLPGETSWSMRPPLPQTVSVANGTKRQRDEDDMEVEAEEVGAEVRSQRSKTEKEPKVIHSSSSSDDFGLNLPLPWEKGCACIVKLYDDQAETLKLCESVEILGILCIDPHLANLGGPSQAWPLPDARSPSTALVPRLHGLVVRRLPFYHPLFPFSPSWLSEARLASAYQRRLASPGAVAAARSMAIRCLEQALGGDTVAAEYVLALLASRVYGHSNGIALGQWSLNLSHWNDIPVERLHEATSALTPLAVHLQVNVETLSSCRWKPKKDFDLNRLLAGRLQLAPGTFLLLDESGMEPGRLDDHGVRSLRALSTLVSDQMLQCDFNTYDVQIPLEVNSLFISKGVSILKLADVVLPMKPTFSASASMETSGLDAARFLLGLVTRLAKPFQMPEHVVAAFSQDFAQVRQEFQEVGQRTVHVWRSLARAICFTHGEEELSIERWRSVMALERERLRRCAAEGIQG